MRLRYGSDHRGRRAECPECRSLRPLTTDGLIRLHFRPEPPYLVPGRCPGSFAEPDKDSP